MSTGTIFPHPAETHVPARGTTSDVLGLYIHLPFCRTKCTYCAFVSGTPRTDEDMDRYLEALLRQWNAAAKHIAGREVSTVFLGGGTPSLMGPDRMETLLQALHARCTISPDAEITIEANPESATTELFARLRPLGLNRVSMGAQTFHEDELAQLGRVHSAGEIGAAVSRAQDAGISNVSIDLIYGLPNQTASRWEENIRRALELPISHLSSYALSFEEGTLLHRLHEKGTVTAAPDETYSSMYDTLCESMHTAGFERYEISNWCREGMASRHNRIYWNRDEYLAMGVSAHGMLNGIRYSWLRNSQTYMDRLLDEENHAFWREDLLDEYVPLTSDVAASDGMIFGLRLREGVCQNAFATRYGYRPDERWPQAIAQCIEQGWLHRDGDRIRIPRNRIMQSNEVLMHFID